MVDQVTLQRINDIHPTLRAELSNIYSEICQKLTGNIGCRFVQVFRSFPEQHALFLQRPKVTNADAGQSYHNYGLAIDFCLVQDKDGDGKISGKEIIWDRKTDLDKDHIVDWMEVVQVFLKYGWKWGATFSDYPHFEKSSLHWRDLLKKYKSGDFIPGTKYVNLAN